MKCISHCSGSWNSGHGGWSSVLQMANFVYSHMAGRELVSSLASSYKGTNPTSDLITSHRKAHLQIPSLWGLNFNIQIGGVTNIQSKTLMLQLLLFRSYFHLCILLIRLIFWGSTCVRVPAAYSFCCLTHSLCHGRKLHPFA